MSTVTQTTSIKGANLGNNNAIETLGAFTVTEDTSNGEVQLDLTLNSTIYDFYDVKVLNSIMSAKFNQFFNPIFKSKFITEKISF